MNLHKEHDPTNRHGGAARAVRWPLVVGLALGIAGCKSTDNKKDDPLFGVRPPNVTAIPPTTGAAPNGPARAAVPPVPGNTSAGSTASLATLPGARPLAINEARPVGRGPATTGGPVVQPIPREEPAAPYLLTTGAWTQPPFAPASNPAPSGNFVDPDLAALQARGGVNPRVETAPEGVRLTVMMPNRANPGAMRFFDVTARDTRSAVEAVLQQVDQQRL